MIYKYCISPSILDLDFSHCFYFVVIFVDVERAAQDTSSGYTANVDPNEDRNQTPTTTSSGSHARLRAHSMRQEITL